jgi:hypothetical protein
MLSSIKASILADLEWILSLVGLILSGVLVFPSCPMQFVQRSASSYGCSACRMVRGLADGGEHNAELMPLSSTGLASFLLPFGIWSKSM